MPYRVISNAYTVINREAGLYLQIASQITAMLPASVDPTMPSPAYSRFAEVLEDKLFVSRSEDNALVVLPSFSSLL